MKNIQFEGVDLFCGAGGVTTGIENAELLIEKALSIKAKVLACVNHDPNAIASHAANHPETEHFVEDIRTIQLSKLPKNRFADNVIFFLHASLECTNFSNAKGGKPRDADSRTLADEMDNYIHYMQPDIFTVENVREFMAWGKLDANGKPVSRDKGSDYLRWVERIKSYGYKYDYRLINSADHGAYTSRLRYFGIFSRPEINIAFPEATHAKNPSKQNGLFGKPLKKWNAVKNVLDLQDEGKSIFWRKKQLSEKSLERMYAGLVKFVAGGKDNFLAKMDQTGSNGSNVISTDRPANTITTTDAHKIVSVDKTFIIQRNSGDPDSKIISIEDPARTITKTGGNQEIVQSEFLIQTYAVASDSEGIRSTDRPARTITTRDGQHIVKTQFLNSYYGNGENVGSTNAPAGAVTTKDRIALVTSKPFFVNDYTGWGQTTSVDNPAPSVMTTPKSKLISAFILNSNFNNEATSIDEPAKTIVASRKHKYLVNPAWFNNSAGSVDDPACTLIARMDKAPLSIITTESGVEGFAIVIYEDDTPMMIKIKEFMALYGIVDIKMRMLKIPELLLIQGFPKGYVLIGTQTEQKKYIGNAVVSLVMKKWFESLFEANKNFVRTIKNQQTA